MRHSLDVFPLSQPPEAEAAGVTLAHVGRAVLREWRWIAVPALIAFIASTVFVTVVSPRYTGEAKLLLESRDSYYTRPGQDRAMEQSQLIDEQAVASQVQVVMSRDLAREAIKRLKLVGNPEFDPLVDGLGPVKRLMMLFGLGNPLERPPEDRVLETYYERLLVYPQGKSRIVTIEFRSKDPELAARAANTIAEVYLDLARHQHRGSPYEARPGRGEGRGVPRPLGPAHGLQQRHHHCAAALRAEHAARAGPLCAGRIAGQGAPHS
jgi:succinoglycan biosynthesis transport protein ExoP